MNDVLNIINKIQKSLEAQISNNIWMDAKTKTKAIEKSKLIRFLVGYPDTVLDKTKLTKLYGKTKEYSSFSESLLKDIRKQNSPSKLLSKLRRPVSKQSWLTSPQTINAYYTAVMNEIILPLGI